MLSLMKQMKQKTSEAKKKVNNVVDESWSVTICESGENHTGMEIIGEKADEGFTVNELLYTQKHLQTAGAETKYYDLKTLGLTDDEERFNRADEAGILIIKNGVSVFGSNAVDFRESMKSINCDKEYWDVRRGRKLNKRARHNVCFANKSQEPDIDNKKGTIININSQEQLKCVMDNLHLYLGEKSINLIAELNHYYNVSKCGIGYHGDTERRIVICVRLGATIPMHFHWYENSKRVGKMMVIPDLEEGDMYIMSDKAGGWDWKLRKNNRLTLRHAAGCGKYTK